MEQLRIKKLLSAYNLTEFLFGLSIVFAVFFSPWHLFGTFLLYGNLLCIIQILRRNGVKITPITMFLLPKKLRNRLFENM